MLKAIFRPVEQWPDNKTPTYSRKRAPFKAAYEKRLNLLERELDHLHASGIVIQAFLRPTDIRNDGWPRSSARPSEPGVIVSFSAMKQSYSYPCDTYDAWEDNLYAVALSLEALRAVNRYGVTKRGEQYQGFRRLEAAQPIAPSEAAIQFLAKHAGIDPFVVRQDPNAAYRTAARKLHPDFGGSHDLFVQLVQHYEVLDKARKAAQA
jgi:hypothetical protein